MNNPLTLDPQNAKLMGVCAGLARWAGADATLIRLVAVLSLLALGPVAILFYLVAGWLVPEAG
ncbi:MAG TPA: PspC domain-containing protein [Allosphingosinicella sp.]|jgi:phage shock protein C